MGLPVMWEITHFRMAPGAHGMPLSGAGDCRTSHHTDAGLIQLSILILVLCVVDLEVKPKDRQGSCHAMGGFRRPRFHHSLIEEKQLLPGSECCQLPTACDTSATQPAFSHVT